MISMEFVKRVQKRNTALSVTKHVQWGVKMVYVNEILENVKYAKGDYGEIDVLKTVQLLVKAGYVINTLEIANSV